MTSDFFNLLRVFIDSAWRFCTEWLVPGTNLTPAELMFTGLFIFFAIRFINNLLQTNTDNAPDKTNIRPNRREKGISIRR